MKKVALFVEDLDKVQKPVAVICHRPWIIASSCNIKGLKVKWN